MRIKIRTFKSTDETKDHYEVYHDNEINITEYAFDLNEPLAEYIIYLNIEGMIQPSNIMIEKICDGKEEELPQTRFAASE